MRNAAEHQDQMQWFEEQCSDELTLARMVAKYKLKVKAATAAVKGVTKNFIVEC